MRRTHRVAIILIVILVFAGLILGAFTARCMGLVAKSIKPVVVPLPPGCSQTANVEKNELTVMLEQKRIERGLKFKSWVECEPANAHTLAANLEHDPRWLESYVAFGYEYRRTVVVPLRLGGVVTTSKAPVVAAIFIKPWPAYLSLIRGQCDGNLRVWE